MTDENGRTDGVPRYRSGQTKKKGKGKGPGKGAGQNAHLKGLAQLKRRVTLAALDGELFPTICHPKKRAYLIAFAETGNKVQAAKAAGVSHATVYSSPWKQDQAFQAGLKVAGEMATDVLEGEAFTRATFGVRKPAGWYKGRPGGYVREYSDILAIFLLKGLRPEKYRDRVEMRGALAHIDISQLPDHLLQRVADGEHIMSVLACAVELGAAGGVDIPKLLGAGPAGAAEAESAGEIVVEEIESDGDE